jgi:uncharacterized protein (TIGR02265 family)
VNDPRLIYTPTFEGLFLIAARGRLSAGAIDQLRAAGLDLGKPLLPGYPARTFTDSVHIAAADLFPGVPRDEAVRRVGEMSLDGYASTLVGRGLFGLLRVLGVRRSILRLARNMGGGTNFLQASAEALGPTDFRAEISDVTGLPTFYQGVLGRAAALLGQAVQVDIERGDPPGCIYRLHW